MKRLTRLLLLLAAGLVPACPSTTPAGTATCATYCARMAALGCPEAKATAKGATCEQVCLNFHANAAVKLDLACKTAAATCAAADACERGK
jgi:hypothetical protein